MVEVKIPGDIMQYEATFIGPFTLRQLVCLGLTAAVEFGYYKLTRAFFPNMSLDNLVGIGTVLAIPIMAFAFVKPYGMKLESYLQVALVSNFLAPAKRPYKNTNTFGKQEVLNQKKQEPDMPSAKLKQHPEFVLYE